MKLQLFILFLGLAWQASCGAGLEGAGRGLKQQNSDAFAGASNFPGANFVTGDSAASVTGRGDALGASSAQATPGGTTANTVTCASGIPGACDILPPGPTPPGPAPPEPTPPGPTPPAPAPPQPAPPTPIKPVPVLKPVLPVVVPKKKPVVPKTPPFCQGAVLEVCCIGVYPKITYGGKGKPEVPHTCTFIEQTPTLDAKGKPVSVAAVEKTYVLVTYPPLTWQLADVSPVTPADTGAAASADAGAAATGAGAAEAGAGATAQVSGVRLPPPAPLPPPVPKVPAYVPHEVCVCPPPPKPELPAKRKIPVIPVKPPTIPVKPEPLPSAGATANAMANAAAIGAGANAAANAGASAVAGK